MKNGEKKSYRFLRCSILTNELKIRDKISNQVKELFNLRGKQTKKSGIDFLNYSGSIYDHDEINAIIDSLLDGWLGIGEKSNKFQKEFAIYNDLKYCLVTNSGSSSSLLAITALCSKETKNYCKPGDEIITPASTFPTTLNPIIQNNLIPVFVDVELGTYNIDANSLEHAISEKTKGIMLPHVLGNPNEMDKIKKIVERYNLFLIEDCCDALGSTYKGQKVGTWGDFATNSFYPAHHMTMGEGGAILTNNLQLKRTAQSIRDWGRDCYCEFNERNPNGACKKRFEFEINGDKIDHRYVYSNIGYNLKPLELQCAMALEQLKKLPTFIRQRKRNFKILYDELEHLDSIFILPRFLKDSEVSWFAFTLTIRENINIKRAELQQYLEKNKIQTRVLFAGNILKHPAYRDINYKIIGKLSNSDKIFKNSFFVGVYPGLSEENMIYIASEIKKFVNNHNLTNF